ncbi:hypothetical protein JWS13_10015 [Rhodococcus pseudokoreensis]|uniref:Uncharacterized protein n=1 Tax=Rhodococcus pseudokoreensis TaxID=2811421 RepID=A0A974ZT77_9NOCA|nr:hypothetical protein [Rhodococcus pseudokoreensis]QSE88917.1 hypothetical protein JWS13_10015 [Rhodococcus pseudokoreensis]
MTSNRHVEMDLGPDWIVRMAWPEEGDIQGGPIELLVTPSDPQAYPAGGISSTVLRSVDFRAATAQLRRQLASADRWRRRSDEYETGRIERIRDALAKGITPEYLALLSSAYVSRVNSGQAKPVERLAEDIGKSLQTIRGHLWRARKDGLLTGSAGRKGGQLTPQASAILSRIVPNAPQSPIETSQT